MGQTQNQKIKKRWFWLSIIVNLGVLCVFKYYNFFALSFAALARHTGLHIDPWLLNIILPVGISFYTFHGLSYVIDVYKNRIEPEVNIITYALFISFFPLLIAGPIERATHLLPQIKEKRTFVYANAADGLRQILWGLFKKIVIADQCAVFVNIIFNNYHRYSGSTLVLGAILFSFQIYGDFSGYSDIATGTARLFSLDLLRNFSFPYFSRNIAEFWRRWHISLATWFRDYLYIPLGGSKGSMWIRVRNIFIIFLISSFWHGANWTFIFWGLLNALYMMPSVIFRTNRNNLDIVAEGRPLPSAKEMLGMIVTFGLTVFAWIFFRSKSVSDAMGYIRKMVSRSLLTIPDIRPYKVAVLIILFILVEWSGRRQQYAIAGIDLRWPGMVRWAIYYIISFAILYFAGLGQPFIYFNF